MATIIQATLDYTLFKRIESNREVSTGHLKRLVKSIQKKNFLYLFPIIINKDMEIVDGQHRLRAAMELKLPIFYMIDDKITKADIAMVNSNRKGWGTMDYIEYFAKEGNEAYKKLEQVIEEYSPIGKTAAASMITDNVGLGSANSGGTASTLIKSGEINDGHYNMAIEILSHCKGMFFQNVYYALKREFIIPIKHLVINSGTQVKEVLKHIKAHETPNEAKDLQQYFASIRKKLPGGSKVFVKKIEPIAPPKRKDVFEGKDILTGEDFKSIRPF